MASGYGSLKQISGQDPDAAGLKRKESIYSWMKANFSVVKTKCPSDHAGKDCVISNFPASLDSHNLDWSSTRIRCIPHGRYMTHPEWF